MTELEAYNQQATGVAHRLYDHALACRMQPLGDGLLGLPRMVRDLARSLDKQARLELDGSATRIDRDILDRLEAPLAQLSEAELLEFLFLPGFTLKDTVTEISGRGVGLDAVQDMLKQVRGTIRVSTAPGAGTRFHLQLPLTLSVVRALLANVGGEPYAFPLAHVVRAVKAPCASIRILEGRQHFDLDGRLVGLVSAHQVLGLPAQPTGDVISIIVLGDQYDLYGLVVDNFLGGRELVGPIRSSTAQALTHRHLPVRASWSSTTIPPIASWRA